jgi:hypothetical protein
VIRWVVVALAGAIVCTVCDHLHATHGVLWYPKVAYWDQSWWVPLLFFVATLAGLFSAGVIRKALGGRELDPPTRGQIAGDVIGFVTAYLYTVFGHHQPNLVLGVLLGFWLVRVLNRMPPWLIVFSLLTGLGGTLFEASWSGLGFFYYRNPDVIGVARWLPGIYLHAAFLMASLERLVRARR